MLLEYIAMPVFSSNFNLPKNSNLVERLIFMYEFYHFKKYNFISVSQTQIGENTENLNNIERYGLAGSYRQIAMLVKTEISGKILRM